MITLLALVEAGVVKADDNLFGLLQGLTREQAEGIADWLAMTTDGPVLLQFTDLGTGVFEIHRTPAQVRAKMKPQPSR